MKQKNFKSGRVKKTLLMVLCAVLMSVVIVRAAETGASKQVSEAGYRIDEPGTITFTVGLKIKGKIEKPQVMIFLPKEKSIYREVEFTHSFAEDIEKPLPFIPAVE